jgi:choline-sulfatase
LIVARPGQAASVCDTPVSLLDISATIPDHFGLPFENAGPGASLYRIADGAADADRAVFSEYHAAGAVSGAFMLRQGDWKLIHYVGFEPELFDLANDPEELTNLAQDPQHQAKLDALSAMLHEICDPEATSAQALEDQAEMIAGYGGREAALQMGARAATPPPELKA